MSWPYLRAATGLVLPSLSKLTALALGDLAQPDGRVIASHRRLMKWTQHSEQTIRRTLRDLERRKLFATLEVADYRRAKPPTLGLRYPGALQVGGPGASQVGGPGAPQEPDPLPGWHLNDPFTDPKSIKAAPRPAPSVPVEKGRTPERPTPATITKLVAVIFDDEHVALDPDDQRGDLVERVKKACAQADFLYDSVVVDDAIKRFLAARGVQPDARDLRHAGRRR